ncbi:MAG: GGDEF domain-containing protein [Candidatus Cloacimonetes bacterium]|nr:GGDEF domain-containing protein [Candidatus Cloacimonadota bacterium]
MHDQLILLIVLGVVGTLCLLLAVWLLHNMRQRRSSDKRLAGAYRELDRTRDELQRSRRIDPLTGLVNGHAVREELAYAEVRYERSGEPFGFVLLRLANLEAIRRQNGDASADVLIVAVAKVIRAQLRKQDIVSRWADGEFLLLLPETNRAGATVVAAKLREKLEAAPCQPDKDGQSPDYKLVASDYDGSKSVASCIAGMGAAPLVDDAK